MNRLCLLLLLLTITFLSEAKTPASSEDLYHQFQNPSNEYRPFVRWWWNGDKVEKDELIRELHVLKDAGIGGVEINPIAFPSKADDMGKKSLVWLSDEWIEMLGLVLDEAQKEQMACDLIVGSGWPFGSEKLPRERTASVMLTYAMEIEGGMPLDISRFHLMSSIDPQVSVPNPGRTCELVSLKLTPDSVWDMSQVEDITGKMEGDMLHLDLPSGKYILYALVRFDSFASVINGAPGASGSMLNHLDAAAVKDYLDDMARAIEKRLGPLALHLRAMFVDSMELEGMNWSSDFSDEFFKRRGYRIEPYLPFTMFKLGRLGNVQSFDYGAKKGGDFLEQVNRARFDFELTKAELLHERYTNVFVKWCKDKQVKSRAQAYGNGFFLLESSLGYDIPECESWTTNWLRHRIGEEMGDEDYRRGRSYTMINKYVTSAAHLAGNRLISAEEMTNTYRVFNTSLELLKVGSDMNAATGVTHSVWHGFNYSPADAPFPGWVRYGTFYNERNPWWPYFKHLNDYRARMSCLLQNADMVTDIAILPPNYDMWTEMGVQTEPFPVKLNVSYTSLIWEAVHKNGGGADYISDKIIAASSVKKGKLCYGSKQYGDIILVENKGLTQESLAKLLEFVQSGGRVFCIGCFPYKSLGLMNYEKRDKEIISLVEKLKSYPNNFVLLEKPQDGRYLEWYASVSEQWHLPHALTISNPDRFLLQSHFKTDFKDDIFLFVNVDMNSSKATDIQFEKNIYHGKNAWLYDANTGKRFLLPMTNGKLHLNLGPSETWIVVLNSAKKGETYQYIPDSVEKSVSPDHWELTLKHSFENWTKDTIMDTLVDLKETSFDKFMGTIEYKTTFVATSTNLPHYIDLGKVCEIAELTVNGIPCGTKWYGRRVFDIQPYVKEGENEISVKVVTMMGNYLQSMPDNYATKRFITSRNHPIVSAGLIGPVCIW